MIETQRFKHLTPKLQASTPTKGRGERRGGANIVTGKSGDNEGEVGADRRTVLGGRICNRRGGTSERHLETFSQLRVAPEKMFIVWGILLWY